MNKPSNTIELIAALKTLKPLQKVHYSWSFPYSLCVNSELLKQVIRLTGSAGHYMDYDKLTQLEQIMTAMKEVQCTRLALNHSPWVGTNPIDLEQLRDGSEQYSKQAQKKAKQIEDLNTKLGTKIVVDAVCIDQETFHPAGKDDDYKSGVDVCNNLSWMIIKECFPHAKIIQYNRGEYQWTDGPKKVFPYYTMREEGDYYACSLYNLPETVWMRKKFMDTASQGVPTIPFVALGGHWPRSFANNSQGWLWKDYPLNYSWTMGAEINHPWYSDPIRSVMYAEWNKAPFVWLWPSPFDDKLPNYGLHFLSYVMGSQTLKEEWMLS